jgi:zinc transport system substrate-binding protein
MTIGRHVLRAAALLALVAALGNVTACADTASETETTGETLTLVTTVPPMGWLAERVGGDNVDVVVMVEPGEDPHTYEPSPADMQGMGEADAYITVDLEFEEAWLPRFADINPDMVIVDAAEGIEKLAAEEAHAEDEHAEDEHAEDEHAHGEEDAHVWTSPAAMAVMGHTLADRLGALDPDNADTYKANARELDRDVAELDARVSAALASSESETFMVFHPAWGYFAREYGLEQVAIESGGQEPSAAELATLIDTARDEGIGVIFVQPSTSTRTAELIADEVGAEVVVVDPLAEDWLANMERVAETFREALD